MKFINFIYTNHFYRNAFGKERFIGYLTKTKYYHDRFLIYYYILWSMYVENKIKHIMEIFSSWADNYKQCNTNLEFILINTQNFD